MTVAELQKLLAAEVKQGGQAAKDATVGISFVGPGRTSYYEPASPPPDRYVGLRYTPRGKAIVSIVVTPGDKTGDDE